jgi:hypothetical protein
VAHPLKKSIRPPIDLRRSWDEIRSLAIYQNLHLSPYLLQPPGNLRGLANQALQDFSQTVLLENRYSARRALRRSDFRIGHSFLPTAAPFTNLGFGRPGSPKYLGAPIFDDFSLNKAIPAHRADSDLFAMWREAGTLRSDPGSSGSYII